jgi:hypothetical protein
MIVWTIRLIEMSDCYRARSATSATGPNCDARWRFFNRIDPKPTYAPLDKRPFKSISTNKANQRRQGGDAVRPSDYSMASSARGPQRCLRLLPPDSRALFGPSPNDFTGLHIAC